jgi:hypothetical protein
MAAPTSGASCTARSRWAVSGTAVWRIRFRRLAAAAAMQEATLGEQGVWRFGRVRRSQGPRRFVTCFAPASPAAHPPPPPPCPQALTPAGLRQTRAARGYQRAAPRRAGRRGARWLRRRRSGRRPPRTAPGRRRAALRAPGSSKREDGVFEVHVEAIARGPAGRQCGSPPAHPCVQGGDVLNLQPPARRVRARERAPASAAAARAAAGASARRRLVAVAAAAVCTRAHHNRPLERCRRVGVAMGAQQHRAARVGAGEHAHPAAARWGREAGWWGRDTGGSSHATSPEPHSAARVQPNQTIPRRHEAFTPNSPDDVGAEELC